MAAHRKETPETVPNGVRFTCCECGAQEVIPTQHPGQARSVEFITRRARNRGWLLGRDRNHDTCAACQKHAPKEETAVKPVVIPMMKLDDILDAPGMANPHPEVPTTVPAEGRDPTNPFATTETFLARAEKQPSGKASKKYTAATLKEQVDIANTLQRLLHRDGEFWGYAEGYDDERVMQEIAPRLTARHIHRIRMELFGPLRKPEPDTPPTRAELSAALKRIDELERLVLELMTKQP
jgi:hypothetical protein